MTRHCTYSIASNLFFRRLTGFHNFVEHLHLLFLDLLLLFLPLAKRPLMVPNLIYVIPIFPTAEKLSKAVERTNSNKLDQNTQTGKTHGSDGQEP